MIDETVPTPAAVDRELDELMSPRPELDAMIAETLLSPPRPVEMSQPNRKENTGMPSALVKLWRGLKKSPPRSRSKSALKPRNKALSPTTAESNRVRFAARADGAGEAATADFYVGTPSNKTRLFFGDTPAATPAATPAPAIDPFREVGDEDDGPATANVDAVEAYRTMILAATAATPGGPDAAFRTMLASPDALGRWSSEEDLAGATPNPVLFSPARSPAAPAESPSSVLAPMAKPKRSFAFLFYVFFYFCYFAAPALAIGGLYIANRAEAETEAEAEAPVEPPPPAVARLFPAEEEECILTPVVFTIEQYPPLAAAADPAPPPPPPAVSRLFREL